jgi:uncharacterized repeat protein (TIGR02543 family)
MQQFAKRLIGLVLAVSFLFSLAGWLFALSGCNSNRKHIVHEEGYFQYIIVDKNSRLGDEGRIPQEDEIGTIVIAGFTESGKEQEVIDFPRLIDGKPVMQIGYRDESFYHYNSYTLNSEKLRKIYIHNNIQSIVNFEGLEVDLMLCSINTELIGTSHGFFKKIYIYKAKFDSTSHNSNVRPANIVFMNNYSDEVNGGYYRLDNIESGEKVPTPPVPNRSGYDFVGWYTESDCITAWDFNNELSIDENTELRLYASWLAI